MGIYFKYPEEFERLWSTHNVGNKKLAFDQFKLLAPTVAEVDIIIAYLIERRRSDKRWAEGKMHHLRTILSQRHWETPDGYEKKGRERLAHPSHAAFADEPSERVVDPSARPKALEELKRLGMLH